MKNTYHIEIRVAIDDEHGEEIIQMARKQYSGSGGAWFEDTDGQEQHVPADEAIESVEDALMELIRTHPAVAGEQVEITAMNIGAADDEPSRETPVARARHTEHNAAPVEVDASESDELDEFEAPVYLCRWPNGDFSVVTAASRREAIIALDEFGPAYASQLHPLDSFMADFTLSDEGEIVLKELGEETGGAVWDICYPGLDITLLRERDSAIGRLAPGARERILAAVERERTRLLKDQPREEASTELGKTIAEQTGASAEVADYFVEQIGKRILESDDDEDRKPN